jgi:hypothetical protein
VKAALRRVKWMPALLVWGDRDRTVSLNSGFRLKRKLRASDLVVVPGGGHSVFEEAPEEANRVMLEWLERHPLPSPGLRERPRASVMRKSRGAAAVRRLSPETTEGGG